MSAAAIAFHHAVHAAVCDRIEPWEHGTALRATRYPGFRAYNCVRLEDAADGLEAAALVREIDRLQEGLPHRQVEVEDPAAGARLRPGFDALAWETERLSWMELRGEARAGPALLEIEEAPHPRTRPLRRAWFGEESDDPSLSEELYDAVDEVAARRGLRALLAWGGAGEAIGYATFAVAGDAAVIDEAWVRPGDRGRGVGGALVAAAVAAAGVARTWIVADDEQRAKFLYARLGFRPAWTQHVYSVRRPPA